MTKVFGRVWSKLPHERQYGVLWYVLRDENEMNEKGSERCVSI